MNIPQEIRDAIDAAEGKVADGVATPREVMAELLVQFPILLFDTGVPGHPLTALSIMHGGNGALAR